MRTIIKLLSRRAPRPAVAVPIQWLDVPSTPVPVVRQPAVGAVDWIEEECSRG